MEKEDNRYVTGGKKEQRRRKELLSWADWGSEGRGAKESCDLAEEGVEGFEGEICRRWREDLLAGRLSAHMASSCWVVLWPVLYPDVCSVPRPGSGWLSNI